MRAALPLVLALLLAAHAEAQSLRLGSVDFPNSGAAEAQEDFLQGVLLLHSFEYGPAAEAFRRARSEDPDFALAHWGEAMSYNHPLWQEQDRTTARGVLAVFTGDAPTEREAMYLQAVSALYGEGSKSERDRSYMEAMRRLHEAYPDDPEARAFYALSILGLTDGERDFGNYMLAAATAQPVLDANPEHPGAAHYIIHSFDDPIHAPLGLPAARAYGSIAPDAAHAQHMTSHIFVAMGMWDDVIRANVNATRVQDAARVRNGAAPNSCGHYSSWLAYGYLMTETQDSADVLMDRCQASQADPDPDDRAYYAAMRARHVIDTEDWPAARQWAFDVSDHPWAHRTYTFATAFAALREGDLTGGRLLVEELRPGSASDPRLRIQQMELDALLLVTEGNVEGAVALLTEAVGLEESLPFEFGPPASLKPPHELLGEVLLAAGESEEAVDAFRGSLEMTPGRVPSLRGLARAAAEAGMGELAESTRRRVEAITGGS